MIPLSCFLLLVAVSEYQLNMMIFAVLPDERKNYFFHAVVSIMRLAWITFSIYIGTPISVFLFVLLLFLYLNTVSCHSSTRMIMNLTTMIYLIFSLLLTLVIGFMGLLGMPYVKLVSDFHLRLSSLYVVFILYNIVCYILRLHILDYLWKDAQDRKKNQVFIIFIYVCTFYQLLDVCLLEFWDANYRDYILLTSGDILIFIMVVMFYLYNHIFVANEVIKKEWEESEAELARQYFEKEKLKLLSEHDSLTNVYNRREISSHIYQLLQENKKVITAYIDLDGLKKTNDLYGHTFGDIMLKHFADVCSSMLLENARIARLGGDEFLIVFQEQECEKVEDWIHKLQGVLLEPQDDKDKILFSYGISNQGKTVEDMISVADERMYQNKKEKRGGLV